MTGLLSGVAYSFKVGADNSEGMGGVLSAALELTTVELRKDLL